LNRARQTSDRPDRVLRLPAPLRTVEVTVGKVVVTVGGPETVDVNVTLDVVDDGSVEPVVNV